MVLLMVPSLWVLGIGCYGFGSSDGSFLGFYLWVLGGFRVEVYVVMIWVLGGGAWLENGNGIC